MKIAVIHLGFFYAGGGERLVLEEVRGLKQLGHEVECFAPIVVPEACYPELMKEVPVHGLLPTPPAWLPARVALWVLLSCVLAPFIALRFRRFDVLFAANQPAPWIAWVTARLVGKPYVAYLAQPNRILYPRDIDVKVRIPNLDYRLAALVAHVAAPLIRWADRVSVAGASAVLANGTYMASVLGHIYRRRMVPSPAGAYPVSAAELDGARLRPGTVELAGLRIPRPYVLLTNRHYPQKRFDFAVRAVGSIPGAVLVITGAPTAYTSAVRALAEELGILDRVIFTGLISDTDLSRLYANAAVYVYPAPEEDYGMGIVEAMGHGVPCVAWGAAGPTSTIIDQETGFLVEPNNQQAFAKFIELLLKDEALNDWMGRAGWRRLRDGLSYDHHFTQLEQELERARADYVPTRSGWQLARPVLQVGLGLLMLGLWARTVPLGDVLAHARPQRPEALLLIPLLMTISGLLRARRWATLLRPVGTIATSDAFWMNAGGGLLNFLFPFRAGEAARWWWVSRRHALPGGSGLATILVDKSFDLAAVLPVIGVAALVESQTTLAPRGMPGGLIAAAFTAATLLVALALLAAYGPRLARSSMVHRLLPQGWRSRLAEQAHAFRTALQGNLRFATLAQVAVLTFAALLVDCLAFSTIFVALGIKVSLLAAVAVYATLLLTYIVPAAPGYVGSLELVGTLILGAGLGLPKATAAGAIVLWHMVNAAIVLGFGALAFRVLGNRRVAASSGRRVAVFHCGFTYSGGGERIVLEEVLGLRRRGFEVECYAPTVDARNCYPDLIGMVGPKTFLPQLPAWVPLRDAMQMAASSVLVPIYAWRFRSFDAIIGANQPGTWIAWCVARLLRKPYVVYLNQPNRLVYPRPIDRQTGWQTKPDYQFLSSVIERIRPFVAWADFHSIRGAGELLVNGRYIGDIIRKTYRREAVDCPAGCHIEEGYPLPADQRFGGVLDVNGVRIRQPFVLLTNRHYPQKRFDLAIRAMEIVHRDHPQVQLIIPGPPTPHTEELRQLVSTLKLEDSVLFLGVIGEEELQNLYGRAAVYVYPAPEEDFGMGVIESMAKGIPVVAWDQAGPTVTVAPGETGYLARPADVADYARGIAGYLADREQNQATGRRAMVRVRQFSWERHVATLEAAIREVLGAPSATVHTAAAEQQKAA